MLRQDFFPTSGCVSRFAPADRICARLKPHKKWDEEGVASTVGTIMALMVFMAFLTMFTSQYVPVWMEENEASHMSTAYGQFAALKQAVDMQILAGTIQGTSPVQMFSPVTLGAEGIPMFASPTPGFLSIYRTISYDNISFSFNNSADVIDYPSRTGGTIKLHAPNRYYIEQELAYENDALILKQPDGQYMKASSQFTVNLAGQDLSGNSVYQISYAQVDLRGDDTEYIGYGTRGVSTFMKSTTTTTFTNLANVTATGAPAYLSLSHTSMYEKAWFSSINHTLSQKMRWGTNISSPATDYTITTLLKSDPSSLEKMYEVSVLIKSSAVSSFTLTVASIEMSTSELGAE